MASWLVEALRDCYLSYTDWLAASIYFIHWAILNLVKWLFRTLYIFIYGDSLGMEVKVPGHLTETPSPRVWNRPSLPSDLARRRHFWSPGCSSHTLHTFPPFHPSWCSLLALYCSHYAIYFLTRLFFCFVLFFPVCTSVLMAGWWISGGQKWC